MKVDPEGAGLDEARLRQVGSHLQARYIEPGKIAGCQVGVVRHGTLGYFESFGSMDLERGRPVVDDTIWRIFSMTKPITAVALLTLYERGMFRLDDPVDRWIPEFTGLQVAEKQPDGSTKLVPPARPMSVRDALMHMTGLGRGSDGPLTSERFLQAMSEVTGGRDGTLDAMVAKLGEQPLVFHPGTQWLYGLSTDMCGLLVERMSGVAFDVYLRDNLFDPLGMVDTGFTVPASASDRLSANYFRGADKKLVLIDNPESSSYLRPASYLSGGGGLVSTTGDYLRFCQMLLDGGELDGVRILGRPTAEMIGINHLPGGRQLHEFALPGSYGEVGFDGVGFGLAVSVGLGAAATQVVGQAGDYSWGGAASTAFWIDPNEDVAVVFMTQLMPSGSFDFAGQLRSIIYGAIID